MPNSLVRAQNAFDQLPEELRNALNYIDENVDPRYFLAMYKNQGLKATLNYLSSIGYLNE